MRPLTLLEQDFLETIRRNGSARLTPLSGIRYWDVAWRLTRFGYLDAHEQAHGVVVFRLRDQTPGVGTSRAS